LRLRNRIAVVAAVTLVAAGSLVLVQVQNAKAETNGTVNNLTGTSITVGNKTLVIDGSTVLCWLRGLQSRPTMMHLTTMTRMIATTTMR
jgi:hypothetical protein